MDNTAFGGIVVVNNGNARKSRLGRAGSVDPALASPDRF
jgi:hypothetical protein